MVAKKKESKKEKADDKVEKPDTVVVAEKPKVKKDEPVTFIWNESKKLRVITITPSKDMVTSHGLTRSPLAGERITIKGGQYATLSKKEIDFLRKHRHYCSERPEGFQEISVKEITVIRMFNEQGKMFKSNVEAIKEARSFIKMSADLKED